MRNSPEWKEIPMRKGSAEEHKIANDWAVNGHTAVFGQTGTEHGHGGINRKPKNVSKRQFSRCKRRKKFLFPK